MSAHRQRGVVLVVSLLMIAVLALLATASINLGSSSMLIVSNQQAEQATAAAANAVVEEALDNKNIFLNGTELPAETRDGIVVSRTAPVCVTRKAYDPGTSMGGAAGGGGGIPGPSSYHHYYRFSVTATETKSGASTETQVGVRMLVDALVDCTP